MNEGLTLHTYGEGIHIARVEDFLKLILALCKALYVITETLASLAFASQEVPQGA